MKKYFLIGIIFASVLFTTSCRQPTIEKKEETEIPVETENPHVEDFLSNVFQIVTYDIDDEIYACGTGFVISRDGVFVTNAHVMENAYSAKGIFETPKSSSEPYCYLNIDYAFVNDTDADLFIGKMSQYMVSPAYKEYRDLRFAESKKGETTYSIGYPNAVPKMEIHKGNITNDMTSIYDKLSHGSTYIGSTSYIAHGSSGGILINSKGEVIGITSRGATTDSGDFVVGASIEYRSFKNTVEQNKYGNLNQSKLVEMLHPNEVSFINTYNKVKNQSNAEFYKMEIGGLCTTGYKIKYYDEYEIEDFGKCDTILEFIITKDKFLHLNRTLNYPNGVVAETCLYADWFNSKELEYTNYIARVDYPDDSYRGIPVTNIYVSIMVLDIAFLPENRVIFNDYEISRSDGFNRVYTWKDQDFISWAKSRALVSYDFIENFVE